MDPATRAMVGKGNQKMVAATFVHDTSRNLDPQPQKTLQNRPDRPGFAVFSPQDPRYREGAREAHPGPAPQETSVQQRDTERTGGHRGPSAAVWIVVPGAVALIGAGAGLIQADAHVAVGAHLLMGGLCALLATIHTL